MPEQWFEAISGRVISEDEAISLEESDTAYPIHLPTMLQERSFSFLSGNYERADPREWDKNKCLELGTWVLGLINGSERTKPITTLHIRRLAELGLAPSPAYIGELFGTFSEYKDRLDSPIGYDRTRFANWSLADFITYAKAHAEEKGQPLSVQEYDDLFRAGEGPSFSLIEDRAGGSRRLHEHLGYPDIRGWEVDDFIDWGIRVLRANPGKELSIYIPAILASRRRGPSLWTIYNRCLPWSEYKARVEEDYETQKEAEAYYQQCKFSNYESMKERGELPEELGKLENTAYLTAAGRFVVAQDCLPSVRPEALRKISVSRNSLIAMIRKLNPDITAGHIEMVATAKHVFDDIWPMPDKLEYLYVSDPELTEARRAHSKKKKSQRNREA